MALKQRAHQLRFPSFPSWSLGTRWKVQLGNKVKKSPSPLMGEGWGEGEEINVCQSVTFPSP